MDQVMSPSEIGQIVQGSLVEGLEMKLDAGNSVEDVRAGKFVVVEGEKFRFFSMITDVTLSTSARGLLDNPPGRSDELMRCILSGTTTYGTISLRPMLMVPKNDLESDLLPVKTIPGHFSPVLPATGQDVNRIFGDENENVRFFNIGTPLDMEETPVCINLERFVERSNGIFGKSGTGKTFLTRIMLCGIIKNRKAANLVFDMHSEYGWKGTVEGDRAEVRGLKQYFRDQVAVFSLDPDSSRRRGAPIDFEVKIPYSQVTVDDIVLLQHDLNLSSTAVETGYALVGRFEDRWLSKLMEMERDDIDDFCEHNNVHQGALSALQRKLRVLAESCKSFLIDDSKDTIDVDAVKQIMSYLDGGKHVVLEFGQHTQPLRYMLVANILTRRIHGKYVEKTEESLGGDRPKPLPLVITIEEAHKFLSPSVAGQTIFGTIAREMRKYSVTLLVVDQRPSGIDAEVLSQVGTRITCLLNDEKDIDAVMTGVSGAGGLRSVLASLDSKQQALVIGHAVPMPVVVKTRMYDDQDFRRSMGHPDGGKRAEQAAREMDIDFA
ncbi:MAG: ATP-binding protein [Armatimonadetes bacterium]|nr:ATP-binding protein [Armatimonadota bacterium]